MKTLWCVLAFVALVLGEEEQVRYDGYTVWSVIPPTQSQLHELYSRFRETKTDVWRDAVRVDDRAVFIVPPGEQEDWDFFLGEIDLDYEIVVDDVQRAYDELDMENELARQQSSGMSGSDLSYDTSYYYTLEELEDWLLELNETCVGCHLHQIGESYKENRLLVMQVSRRGSSGYGIFLMSGVHAREWIAPAANAYVLDMVLNSDDEDIDDLRQYFNFYFVILLNPDGYNYTHIVDRNWRKNRKTLYGPGPESCYGVDLNRNWGYQWGGGNFSFRCDQDFRGYEPFSEEELMRIIQFMMDHDADIKMAMSLRGPGQRFLSPWLYSTGDEGLDHAVEHFNMTTIGVDAINEVHDQGYTTERIVNSNNVRFGTSTDWTYGFLLKDHSYQLDLRDGNNNFVLPAVLIQPTAEEAYAGIKAMAFALRDELESAK